MATAPQLMPMLPAGQTSDMALDAAQWEGDQMFNVYIHDYFCRRGYKKSAQELQQEAKLGPEPNPPISSRQGLLFEWWTVFWGIFTAKSQNPQGETAITADAQSYMRWHLSTRNGQPFMNGANPPRMGPNGRPLPPTSTPLTNGGPPLPNGTLPNGQMPNGFHPNARLGQPAGPSQPGQPRPPQPGMYASPQMAPSPNSNANSQGSSGSGQGPGPSPRMSHLNNSMPPPSGLTSARPPSRTDTPSRTGHPNQSPAMINRGLPMPPGYRPGFPIPGMPAYSPQQIEQEYRRVPPSMLPGLRSELGISDAPQLSAEDKSRIVYHCIAKHQAMRVAAQSKPGEPGSGPHMAPVGMQPNPMAGPSANTQPHSGKRNSESPEDNSMGTNESSPSAAKRPRRSPQSAPQSAPQPGGPMGAPGSNMGPMPGQPGFMNGRQVPGGIPPNMPPNSTTPFNHPGSAMLPPHMVQGMYGMSHGQPGQPGGPMGSMPPPPRGPPVPTKIPTYSADMKQFTETRMSELKPGAAGMPPPSSPATIPPKPPASAPPGGGPSMKMEQSPSFAHTSVSVPGSMGSNTNPPTPVPGSVKMANSSTPMSVPSPGQILAAQGNPASAGSSGGTQQQQQQPVQATQSGMTPVLGTSLDFAFSDDLFGTLGNLDQFDFMSGMPQGPDDMSGLGFGRQFENWMDPNEQLMK